MPEQVDLAQQWQSFSQDRRAGLLKRMSPEQKKSLRAKLETPSTPVAAEVPEPPTIRQSIDAGLAPQQADGLIGNLREAARGIASGIISPVLHPIQTIEGMGEGVMAGGMTPYGAPINAPTGNPQIDTQNEQAQAGARSDMAAQGQEMAKHPAYTAGTIIGPALATHALGKIGAGVGALRSAAVDNLKGIRPVETEIAGEKIPVLAGEAKPETAAGRYQKNVKKSGHGAGEFDKVSREQQEGVKEVIRKVAKSTANLQDVREEPGDAMRDAADATHAQARPLYGALDKSLAQVPDKLSAANGIVKTAIQRAQKLGIEIDTSPHNEVMIDGRKFSPGTDPAVWDNLKAQGLVNDNPEGQPLSTYLRVKSQLLKMQRSSADPAYRNAVGNEVRAMNDQMEQALRGTPQFDQWKTADRLWAKGYAIRDVAEAIRKSTKGTPAAQQAGNLSKVPTKIASGQIVNRLNDLQNSGVLSRAFSPEETSNLRRAVDILDRSTGSPGARGVGRGYSIRSATWHALMRLPMVPVVKMMTTPTGVEALERVAKAPAEGQLAAVDAFAGLAGVQPVKNRKEAMDLLQPAQ